MFGKAFNKNYLKYIMMILVVFNLYPSGNKLDVETDEATIDFNNEENNPYYLHIQLDYFLYKM